MRRFSARNRDSFAETSSASFFVRAELQLCLRKLRLFRTELRDLFFHLLDAAFQRRLQGVRPLEQARLRRERLHPLVDVGKVRGQEAIAFVYLGKELFLHALRLFAAFRHELPVFLDARLHVRLEIPDALLAFRLERLRLALQLLQGILGGPGKAQP